MTPLVSIIINGYNCAHTLAQTLDCVLAQSFDAWEVIFFDSASTDTSLSVAQKYAAKHARIRCIAHPARPILGQARNLALSHACGEYVAFLDADDLWEPQKLAQQVTLLEQSPTTHLVCTDTSFFSTISCGKTRILTRAFSRTKPARGRIFEELIERQWIILSSVMVRRSIVEKLGSFDPTLQLAADADLFYRLAHDHDCDFIPQVLTHRRMHAHNISHSQGHLWPQEIQTILTKLHTLWPEFDQNYPKASKALQGRVCFHTAVHLWRMGQGAQARKLLWQSFFSAQRVRPYNVKVCLLFFFSHMSPRFFRHAERLYWRLPSSFLKDFSSVKKA